MNRALSGWQHIVILIIIPELINVLIQDLQLRSDKQQTGFEVYTVVSLKKTAFFKQQILI